MEPRYHGQAGRPRGGQGVGHPRRSRWIDRGRRLAEDVRARGNSGFDVQRPQVRRGGDHDGIDPRVEHASIGVGAAKAAARRAGELACGIAGEHMGGCLELVCEDVGERHDPHGGIGGGGLQCGARASSATAHEPEANIPAHAAGGSRMQLRHDGPGGHAGGRESEKAAARLVAGRLKLAEIWHGMLLSLKMA